MDITAIYDNSLYKENKIERLLPKLSHVNPFSNVPVLDENRNRNCDALLAVKLDPAVLEAQVTIEKTKCSKSKTEHQELQLKKRNAWFTDPQINSEFEKAISLQRAAIFSLSSQQFILLMKYVDTLRQQRMSLQKHMECAFCKKNGHPEVWFTTHALKDRKGRVKCPILRTFSCRRCGATGDQAHTIKYCPHV